MPAIIRHVALSGRQVSRLLDELTAAGDAVLVSLTLPAGAEIPEPPAQCEPTVWEALLTHAARSESGAFIFVQALGGVAVAPPFPIGAALRVAGYHDESLRRLLDASYRIGVVLLRRGGYAVGVFEGDRLVASKNDARFVKNRHRKGGQSQRRFDRIREKQVHELLEHACADAQVRLAPFAGQLDFVAYGGDRLAIRELLRACRFLRQLPTPVLPRFLNVSEPRHQTLVTLPEMLRESRVTFVTTDS